MAKVVMYTTGLCPYCHAAKQLFKSKNISFDEIRVDRDPAKRAEMMKRSNRRTVPQIWVGQTHVGGYDDAAALESQGRLDNLLKEQ
ncbi:MAG: glutaredoxin 3 [Litorivicinus sp.]